MGQLKFTNLDTRYLKAIKNEEKNLAMRKIVHHAQRILRHAKVKKNVDKMIENFLSKSKQVMAENILSRKEKSIIKKETNQVKTATANKILKAGLFCLQVSLIWW